MFVWSSRLLQSRSLLLFLHFGLRDNWLQCGLAYPKRSRCPCQQGSLMCWDWMRPFYWQMCWCTQPSDMVASVCVEIWLFIDCSNNLQTECFAQISEWFSLLLQVAAVWHLLLHELENLKLYFLRRRRMMIMIIPRPLKESCKEFWTSQNYFCRLASIVSSSSFYIVMKTIDCKAHSAYQ